MIYTLYGTVKLNPMLVRRGVGARLDYRAAGVAGGSRRPRRRDALGAALEQIDSLSQHDEAGLRAIGVLRGIVSVAV